MCCTFCGVAASEVRVTGVTLPNDDTGDEMFPTGVTDGFHVEPPLIMFKENSFSLDEKIVIIDLVKRPLYGEFK
jgi:hypothetical protein